MRYKNIIIIFVLFFEGCSVTSHPNYQTTYYKKNVDDSSLQTILLKFKENSLTNASVEKDPLGRVQLIGSYENEIEVSKALSLVESVVGYENVNQSRPQDIKVLDWELQASKEFSKFLYNLAIKYQMSLKVYLDGAEVQLLVNNQGLDNIEQFESNSSNPTIKAKDFYLQMGKKIVEVSGKDITKKKFLVVGHTDDVGDTEKNAFLSEQRALKISQILSSTGIPLENIYYQGAGETLPFADNKSENGRSQNRRVEITELSSDANLSKYIQNRQPNLTFYRYKSNQQTPQFHSDNSKKNIQNSTLELKPSSPTIRTPVNSPQNAVVSESIGQLPKFTSKVNFGGKPYSNGAVSLDVGGIKQAKSSFSFISTARADSIAALNDCTLDRPRISGEVKSLKTNSTTVRKTSEFAPRLYGKTWAGEVNSNLVVLNRVYVLRESGEAPISPQLNIYANYKDPKKPPDLSPSTSVNSYLVGKGILYRVFPNQMSGVNCIDILFPVDGTTEARAGKIVYATDKSLYVADFIPQMQN
jgi:outer membrane protein OmpA-like peptidoglycan-associated protein